MRAAVGKVVDLGAYRERRSVRRAGAYVVVAFGVLGAIAELYRARELLDACIRKGAELLPEATEEDPSK